ncbi:major facilitator superfamily domain-containing protein [Neohortaea acidophila]|uniref:Major facilitator superfamily domain-containing protein n=1 Tax=Neohortaea acidophila TaxID=245834 RepID=A0A6A6PLM3_9PEZI|nr:major facilitator superfamily domain-containing protein [Neohortaea acidophila]KAF2480988.1 major facilitator superfamily domain-containing protein [Neohortaea acidophila]
MAATMVEVELQPLTRAKHPETLTETPQSRPASIKSDPIDHLHAIPNDIEVTPDHARSKLHKVSVVFQLCAINFMASFASGAITVGLPTIAVSLAIPEALYTWPSSVYGLASGATILLSGAVANVVGARIVDLVGTAVLSISTLACAFSQSPIQLIVFRALQGTGISMHFPASVALVTAAVPAGKGRNMSFACLGLSQPLGFSAGLVVSGVMIEKTGWRSTFYLAAAGCVAASIAGFWILPTDKSRQTGELSKMQRLRTEVDWIGSILASAGLALLSYVLAVVSADTANIHKAVNASLLALSFVALAAFPLWMRHRERSGQAPLIPNSLWKKKAFTCMCAMVTLSWGAGNAMELFSSLYFQNIQHTSTIFTSLRLLPNLTMAVIVELVVGLIVDKTPIRWAVVGTSVLSAIAPLLMGLVDPKQPFWYMELWAQILAPISGDVLFTIGLLVVSEEFTEDRQALAGAVFNTVAQFGWSLGIGLCQVAAFVVTQDKQHSGDGSRSAAAALLDGYRASFWTIFAFFVTIVILALGGLQKLGKIGAKQD